jgi:predicted RNA methylase
MKVPANILTILRAATTDGPHLHLAGPQMDPRLYQRVNEVIEGVGGQWDKNTQAHVFPTDAAQAIRAIIDSGHVTTLREARQASQYFPTPPAVVSRLIDLAEIEPGMTVLEPSAGRGAIAKELATLGAIVDCVERDPGHAAALQETGSAREVKVADFLAVPAAPRYDRIVMNPPFTGGADVQHVTHALRFLKPGGLLVAVMSWGVTFGRGPAAEFRKLVEHRGGAAEACPEKSFAESGTGVETIIVVVPAARRSDAKPVVWPTRVVEAEPETEPDFQPPLEILAEIQADMRQALVEFDALAKLLAEPAAPQRSAEVVELPVRPQQEQLPFENFEVTP